MKLISHPNRRNIDATVSAATLPASHRGGRVTCVEPYHRDGAPWHWHGRWSAGQSNEPKRIILDP